MTHLPEQEPVDIGNGSNNQLSAVQLVGKIIEILAMDKLKTEKKSGVESDQYGKVVQCNAYFQYRSSLCSVLNV